MGSHDTAPARVAIERGLQQVQAGNAKDAIDCFKQAIALDVDCVEAWEKLATVLQDCYEDKGAEQVLAMASDKGVLNKAVWYALANALHGPRAQQAYKCVLEIDPTYEPALSELAWSYRVTGQAAESLVVYRRLMDLYAVRRDYVSLNSLGDTLRRLVGAVGEAEECFRLVLEIDPANFLAWKNLSYLMCSKKDPIRAQQIARQFIQTYPDHPRQADAWVCLGNVLRSVNDLTGAEEALRNAIRINENSQSAWSKLADVLFELGNIEEGQKALHCANNLDYNQKFDDTESGELP